MEIIAEALRGESSHKQVKVRWGKRVLPRLVTVRGPDQTVDKWLTSLTVHGLNDDDDDDDNATVTLLFGWSDDRSKVLFEICFRYAKHTTLLHSGWRETSVGGLPEVLLLGTLEDRISPVLE